MAYNKQQIVEMLVRISDTQVHLDKDFFLDKIIVFNCIQIFIICILLCIYI